MVIDPIWFRYSAGGHSYSESMSTLVVLRLEDSVPHHFSTSYGSSSCPLPLLWYFIRLRAGNKDVLFSGNHPIVTWCSHSDHLWVCPLPNESSLNNTILERIGSMKIPENSSPQSPRDGTTIVTMNSRELSNQHWGSKRKLVTNGRGTHGLLISHTKRFAVARFWEREVNVLSCISTSESTTFQWIVPNQWSHILSWLNSVWHKTSRCEDMGNKLKEERGLTGVRER